MSEQTNIFLDDIREPEHAFDYTNEKMFLEKKWIVVRNYNEFVAHIESNGLPDFISFDHDLAHSHYTPEHLWSDYGASRKWQDEQVHEEKTGYECAKWLVDYCIVNNLKFPEYYCHSMNPVGKDNIVFIINLFKSLEGKPRTFYRVANIETSQGLWYDKQGNFTGLIHKEFDFCSNNKLLMPYDKDIVGWLSSTDTLENLWNWFTKEDIKRLEEFGYFISVYEATKYRFHNNHWVICQETSVLKHKLPLTDIP